MRAIQNERKSATINGQGTEVLTEVTIEVTETVEEVTGITVTSRISTMIERIEEVDSMVAVLQEETEGVPTLNSGVMNIELEKLIQRD